MNSTLHGYVNYADSTLRGFTKERLIDEIKCLRHNLDAVHEQVENQFRLLNEFDLHNTLLKQKLKDVKFEWYVLNRDEINQSKFTDFPYHKNLKVKPHNIFDNGSLNKYVNEHCRKFYRREISYDDFVGLVRKELHYYLRAKVQYEIAVVDYLGSEHGDKLERYDCYMQILPNLDFLAKTVLWQFRNWQNKD